MRRTKAQLLQELEDLQERLRIAEQAQESTGAAGHIEVETAQGEALTAGTGEAERDRNGETEGEQKALAAVEVGKEEEGLFHPSLHPKKEAWLKAFALSGGKIEEAAAAAGVSRWAHHYWLKVDEAFRELYPQAQAAAVETLRDEVLRRGREGVDEPVFYQGKQIATVKKYSDNLLMFETKRQDPLYRDNYNPALLTTGGDVTVQVLIPRPGPKVQMDQADQVVDVEARELGEAGEGAAEG